MIEAAIVARLKATPAIVALVKDRIGPLLGARVRTLPAIVISIEGDEGRNTYQGAGQHRRAAVDVVCYASTYLGCSSLADLIRTALHHYAGTIAGVVITPSLLEDQTDVEQALDPGTGKPIAFVKSQTFRILYRPA